MKTIILILAACCTHALAGTVTLAWDAQEGATFEVWRGLELVATVTEPGAILTLPDDQVSSLVVFAINEAGERFGPSSLLHLLPLKPQASLDLLTWITGPTFYLTIPAAKIPAKAFFRMEYMIPQP